MKLLRRRACPGGVVCVSLCLMFVVAGATAASGPVRRSIPQPLPGHPGNVFLAGEEVVFSATNISQGDWRVRDYGGNTLASGRAGGERFSLGRLPVGYYELTGESPAVSKRVSFAVLAPLRAPTPRSSPIAIDVAMAWFFETNNMAAPANLCALAGINRVRDRLSWGELEPRRGDFVPNTRYDASVRAQAAAGLQVLEVGHASPAWANPNGKRFPPDLRDAYRFYDELARRWAGQVEAFEPWNEADIDVFGGHTGSEMASLQKAAYFGLKHGNPHVIACLNVFALHRAATLRDFDDNECWPYFDTFNLHHYEPLRNYPKLYADFRAVSAGKPLWVTECCVRVNWSGDDRFKEPTDADLRLQSERVTKTFALGLFEGAQAVFYFLLPNYTEGPVQFGLLHADLTPRPGYVALAAVGRLLADARVLGRLPLADEAGNAYFFDARPDGKPAIVAVVWAERETVFEMRAKLLACYDHLGRVHESSGGRLTVGREPLFLMFPRGAKPELLPPPQPAPSKPGEPSPIVLQAIVPEQDIVLGRSAYRTQADTPTQIPLYIYNFGERTAEGRLSISCPENCRATVADDRLAIRPGERKQLNLNIRCPATAGQPDCAVRINGDFGSLGRPVLALRFLTDTQASKAKTQ